MSKTKFQVGDIVKKKGAVVESQQDLMVINYPSLWENSNDVELVCRAADRQDLKKPKTLKPTTRRAGDLNVCDVFRTSDGYQAVVTEKTTWAGRPAVRTSDKDGCIGIWVDEQVTVVGCASAAEPKSEETPEYMTRADMRKLAAQEARRVIKEELSVEPVLRYGADVGSTVGIRVSLKEPKSK